MFGSGPLLSLGFVSIWSAAVFAVSLVVDSGLDAVVVVVVMVVAEVGVVGASVVVGNVGGSARKKKENKEVHRKRPEQACFNQLHRPLSSLQI